MPSASRGVIPVIVQAVHLGEKQEKNGTDLPNLLEI